MPGKILVTEKLAAGPLEDLRTQGFEVDVRLGLSPEELRRIIGGYAALIVRSATKVNRELLDAATNMIVVGRAGTGVDNIDVPYCTEKGIVVVNTPTANTMAAAELTVGLIYALFRNICLADRLVRQGDFRRNLMTGSELTDKKAALVGLGRIGSTVAEKLRGVGMDVIAYDPYVATERFERLKIERCESLEGMLPRADVVSIHMPLTPDTVNMIGAKELALCRPGVRVVNAARGGLIDETALYEALVSGHVAGAALDVLAEEPNYNLPPEKQTFDHPLLHLPNVIYMPHLGASTYEAQNRVGEGVADAVAGTLRGEMVSAVNLPGITAAEAIRPYISLAEKLGAIYYQSGNHGLDWVEVAYSGSLLGEETGLLTLSVLKGILTPITDQRLNFVNIRANVEELGIKVTEKKDPEQDVFENLIRVTFGSGSEELCVSGTIFARDREMLVSFYGYTMDFELCPYVLAIHNNDVPGIIGQVGTILGNAGVNIASMHWSRKLDRGRAQAFVGIDTPISEELYRNLTEIEGVIRVSRLFF
ncbi:MAG: phosphoglycerate dehydrogenase [Clostridiaceae bacterium]|nr:phosphoglycerate dehydrogenase [Clostridiaceae bacterium]